MKIAHIMIKDDDCHWYLIPLRFKKDFENWSCNSNEYIPMEDYDKFRIDGPHRILIYDWEEI